VGAGHLGGNWISDSRERCTRAAGDRQAKRRRLASADLESIHGDSPGRRAFGRAHLNKCAELRVTLLATYAVAGSPPPKRST